MADKGGLEPPTGLYDPMLYRKLHLSMMVSDERIELPCSACKTDAFPLDESELFVRLSQHLTTLPPRLANPVHAPGFLRFTAILYPGFHPLDCFYPTLSASRQCHCALLLNPIGERVAQLESVFGVERT